MPLPLQDGVRALGKREGEVELASDPALLAADAHLVFIGRVHSPWLTRDDCPKNIAAARERGQPATVQIDPEYRQGLNGLEEATHVVILTWLHLSPRSLIVQKPRHAARARGTFALRSPVRPNPIGLHVARLLSVDQAEGRLTLEGIDVLDGTPVIDVKPYYVSTDAVPEATVKRSDG